VSVQVLQSGRVAALRRAWRYVTIYGWGRTWFKIAARLRLKRATWRRATGPRDIGFIGCGQYAFATLGYFLHQRFGARVLACYDIDADAAATLARALQVPHACENADSFWAVPGLRTVYIASNHASHVPYALQALSRGIDVYIEKPVAVSREQLRSLVDACAASGARIHAGYNRPFAGATRTLRALMPIDADAGMTLQCFVSGHRLAADHWYRHPDEGTRVCGNLGHWLDLLVHVLAWRGLPDRLDIALTCADDAEPDDNLSVALRSDRGDLFVVTLGSLSLIHI
jgi:predicted dehydrogenase